MTGQHAGTVMECGVCWTRYDPAEGDAVAQIPAGTPFSALPDLRWREAPFPGIRRPPG